jgi:GNAT superfamily N-acetyltransferase
MNAGEFLERAGPLLLADEARHNLILGVAGTVRDLPHLYPDARFWVVDGAAALQTPPYNAIVAKPRDREALAALVAAIDGVLPGVTAASPEAEEFAELWGRPATPTRKDNIWELRVLRPAPPTNGRPREATRDDVELILDWFGWFQVEEELVRRQVEQRLGSDAGGVTLWEVGGEPVSMCGYGSPTPNGMRIGPVYTPPEHRGQGYAGAVTADVSRRQLQRGRFCFLYTDASNATAEGVYERLGYQCIAASRQLAFAKRRSVRSGTER